MAKGIKNSSKSTKAKQRKGARGPNQTSAASKLPTYVYIGLYGVYCFLVLKFTIFIYGLLGGFITEETSALAKNLIEFCQYMVASLAPTFVLAGLFTIIELKLTGRPRTKSTYTLSFLNLLISFGGFAVFVFFFEKVLRGANIEPLINLSQTNASIFINYAIAFAYFFVSDLLLYWVHRWEHKNKFLWYLHQIHHAAEDLDSVSGAFHPLSNIIRWCLTLLPLSFLISVNLADVLILSSFLSGVHFVQHTRAPLYFGWFGKVIGDNRFHFLHHSKDPKYFNKNFAAVFPVIDMMFGTYMEPNKGMLPETGLSHLKGAQNVKEFLSGQLSPR